MYAIRSYYAVTAKILNQAGVLHEKGIPVKNMQHWAKSVTSGDTQNHEARAASYNFV